MDEGTFREDLYYRLKMGKIVMPPLRDRKQDIPHLIEHFLRGDFSITKEAQRMLSEYPWKGNIRELKGTLEYMKAIADQAILTVNELPYDVKPVSGHNGSLMTHEELELLRIINRFNRQQIACGRQKLQKAAFSELGLSENQIRSRLIKLSERGLVENKGGRSGSFVTELGMKLLASE